MRSTKPLFAFLLLTALLCACSSAAGSAVVSTGTAEHLADLPPATATAPPTPVPTATPPPADRIKVSTTTKTEYYAVYGSNSEDILSYIQDYAPVDEKGARAVGLTSYTPSLDWDSNHDPRACAISRMTIGVDLKVTLPALANLSQMAPALRSNWTTYAAGVSAHEQRHVDIWQRGAETIRQKMAEITPTVGCSALEARVLEVWKTQQDATSREQDLFHQQEFARLDAARAPLKSQIDANRGNLDSLTLQIAGLDASLATLSQQIDPLKNLMDSLQTQIRAIEEKYKGTSPPGDIYDQYQRLISQYNNLIPSFNALIGQYNSQVGQRSTLAAQAETLRIQTNDLVEQYNWVR